MMNWRRADEAGRHVLMAGFWTGYQSFVQNQAALLFTIILAALLAAVVVFLLAWRRLRSLIRLYRSAQMSKTSNALDQILLHQEEVGSGLTTRVVALERGLAQAEAASCRYVQISRLSRYAAFRDTGGNQSFSWILLDAEQNGLILTSISGRDESRVYAKQIMAGVPEHPLAAEEQRLLEDARKDFLKYQEDNRSKMAKT
jgi:hypothetical protein